MNIDILSVFAGVLGTVSAAILGWFTFLRKTKNDETTIALDAWKELLEPLRKQLEDTKRELEATKIELTLLREHLEKAEKNHKTQETKLRNRIRELEETLRKD